MLRTHKPSKDLTAVHMKRPQSGYLQDIRLWHARLVSSTFWFFSFISRHIENNWSHSGLKVRMNFIFPFRKISFSFTRKWNKNSCWSLILAPRSATRSPKIVLTKRTATSGANKVTGPNRKKEKHENLRNKAGPLKLPYKQPLFCVELNLVIAPGLPVSMVEWNGLTVLTSVQFTLVKNETAFGQLENAQNPCCVTNRHSNRNATYMQNLIIPITMPCRNLTAARKRSEAPISLVSFSCDYETPSIGITSCLR